MVQNEIGTKVASTDLGRSATPYLATRFLAASDYIIRRIVCHLERAGTPPYMARASIFSDDSNKPGSLVGTPSDWRSVTDVSTSEDRVIFSNVRVSVDSGSYYWVVLEASTNTGDASNKVAWVLANGTVEHVMSNEDLSTSWSEVISVLTGKYCLYRFVGGPHRPVELSWFVSRYGIRSGR